MSSSTRHIIVSSDYDVDDAFFSTHSPDYTPASPDYFPVSPGNTSLDPSDDLSKYLLASLAISPFYNDPYMTLMQAYDATNNESPIPLPQAPLAPPTILPSSPVLPLSPMFDAQDFFLPEEILPPQKRARFLSSSSNNLSASPQVFENGENYHGTPDTSYARHEEQIETIISLKNCVFEFSAIVSSNFVNFGVVIQLNFSNKLLYDLWGVIFGVKKIYPCESRIIINDHENILLSVDGCYHHWSA
ncbi:hypothetical protein Tco_1563729 [Tanacetum coccineum]